MPVLHTVADRDVVQVSQPATGKVGYYLARSSETAAGRTWTLVGTGANPDIGVGDLRVYPTDPARSDQVKIVTATVTVFPDDPEAGLPQVWGRLPLDGEHVSFGAKDALTFQFAEHPENLSWRGRRSVPIVVIATVEDGLELFDAVIAVAKEQAGAADAAARELAFLEALIDPLQDPDDRSVDLLLEHGDDGIRPGPGAYEGQQRDPDDKSGLKQFEDLEEISIVAAPGATAGMSSPLQRPLALGIVQCLISHAERMRYRIAVLESGDNQDLTEVSAFRAGLDSKHAALLLPVGAGLRPDHQAARSPCRRPASSRASTRATTRARRLQGAGQRGRDPGHRLRADRSTRRSRRC